MKMVHKHCAELIAPGTLFHIGSKFLQMAATNCTHAGHFNTYTKNKKAEHVGTEWCLYKNYVSQNKRWLDTELKHLNSVRMVS